MAESKCPKCESTKFELISAKPANASFPVSFVQCVGCGCVVGALDGRAAAAVVEETHNKLMAYLATLDQKLITLQFKP